MEYVVSRESWKFISKHLSKVKREDTRGRKRRRDRDIYEGIMWLFNSGARWQDMPKYFPSKSTCHRRFSEWSRDGS